MSNLTYQYFFNDLAVYQAADKLELHELHVDKDTVNPPPATSEHEENNPMILGKEADEHVTGNVA